MTAAFISSATKGVPMNEHEYQAKRWRLISVTNARAVCLGFIIAALLKGEYSGALLLAVVWSGLGMFKPTA